MMTMTFNRKQISYFNSYRNLRIKDWDDWQCGRIEMCHTEFARFFQLGRAKRAHLIFTKTAHPDAYLMECGEASFKGGNDVPMVGGYEPGFMSSAANQVRTLWHAGYNYVRCEVEA